jgi:hypothetical protein
MELSLNSRKFITEPDNDFKEVPLHLNLRIPFVGTDKRVTFHSVSFRARNHPRLVSEPPYFFPGRLLIHRHQKEPRGDYSRFLNILKNVEETRSNSVTRNLIRYVSKEEWEAAPRSEKLLWISNGVTVVKHRLRYFQGGDDQAAQRYFDEGANRKREPVMDAMLRLGLEPRSLHQIVGELRPFSPRCGRLTPN